MKKIKKLVMLSLTLLLISATLNSPQILLNHNAKQISYHVKSSKIDWRFKFINNQLYKRLFNYTTNSWIGDWILVK